VNDVANIGSDYEITILDLARKIIKLTKSTSKIVFLPALKEGDMTRRCPDISVMKQLLQRPMTPIEEGIQRLIDTRISVPA
jgi:nucleoside-diphosphate-sugar epimerase